eukprot:TRINITY_DN3438_c3_g1_i1.p1 TRINITY_DN3438_c3_g1~~TRINITY_DN3438_c3_g1_i1.p1  ORF type:complete len:430 (+),score=61.07 TRINITY_DN3438_c3_g1_i1:57-1346(+)
MSVQKQPSECASSESERHIPEGFWEEVDDFFTDPKHFDDRHGGWWARAINWTTIAVILLSQFTLCFESAPQYYSDAEDGESPWIELEISIVTWFTLELILRFIASSRKLLFFTDMMNIFDLLSVLPFYFEMALSTEISFNFKVLRVLRVIRVIKMTRFHGGLQTIAKTLVEVREQLLMGLLIIVICVWLWSSIIFFIERSASTWSPEHQVWVIYDEYLVKNPNGTYSIQSKGLRSPFQSIPHSFWWCITTVTTVGYGDAVPATRAGRAIAAVTMVSGVFILSLPTSIIGSKFLELYKESQHRKEESIILDAKNRKDNEMVDLLVFIDELVARGKLTATSAYTEPSGNIVTRPGDAQEIRTAAFQEKYYPAIRHVFRSSKRAVSETKTIERFTKGMMELNLQRRYFMKPKRTEHAVPWVPNLAAVRHMDD